METGNCGMRGCVEKDHEEVPPCSEPGAGLTEGHHVNSPQTVLFCWQLPQGRTVL